MQNNLPLPSLELPIYIIGAGGIVNTAHLPAYEIAGYNVQGIYDLDVDKALATAANFNIPHVFAGMEEMIAELPANAIIDIAVPGSKIISVLEQLPEGATILLQKPMGDTYGEAKQILDIARNKKLLAGINFQLRYAPYILAAKDLVSKNLLGELNDIEVNVNVYTPWDMWDYLVGSSRVEILYHSIHYIDLIRNLLGNPHSVFAKTTRHPSMPKLASVRSNIIMDYGDMISANILTNHCHIYGTPKQQSYIKIEGSKGAVKINFGALIDYPRGAADSFEYILLDGSEKPQWKEMKIHGSWFPHAFIGSMEQMMLAAKGKIPRPDNSVEDCIDTMACVEAAYLSNEKGGVTLKEIQQQKHSKISP
jgi:predicted dehydrogenase